MKYIFFSHYFYNNNNFFFKCVISTFRYACILHRRVLLILFDGEVIGSYLFSLNIGRYFGSMSGSLSFLRRAKLCRTHAAIINSIRFGG